MEFTSADWFTITGRGLVVVPQEPCDEPGLLVGEQVLVDGERYLVRGAEKMGLPPYKPGRYALLVRKVSSEQSE